MRRLLAAVVIVACAPAKGPNETLDKYSTALKAHDYAAAYDLMSSSFRGKVSRDDYVRMMRDNANEVTETADRLRGRHTSIEVSAEFEYGLGDQMRLVQESGRWRVATNPLAFYDQSTPQATLRSFIRAYRLERWDIILRELRREVRGEVREGGRRVEDQRPRLSAGLSSSQCGDPPT